MMNDVWMFEKLTFLLYSEYYWSSLFCFSHLTWEGQFKWLVKCKRRWATQGQSPWSTCKLGLSLISQVNGSVISGLKF